MFSQLKYVHLLYCIRNPSTTSFKSLPDIQLTGGNLQLVTLIQVHNSSIPLAFVITVHVKTSDDQPPDHNDH